MSATRAMFVANIRQEDDHVWLASFALPLFTKY